MGESFFFRGKKGLAVKNVKKRRANTKVNNEKLMHRSKKPLLLMKISANTCTTQRRIAIEKKSKKRDNVVYNMGNGREGDFLPAIFLFISKWKKKNRCRCWCVCVCVTINAQEKLDKPMSYL